MLGTHPLVRFINQNRRQIRITILVIIVFLLILRFLNSLAEKKVKSEIEQANSYYSNIAVENEYKKVIQNFLNYCINGDESNAYALLSSETKKDNFTTLNKFNEIYINKFFNSSKTYSISNIASNNTEHSYSVVIKDDILSTGNVNSNTITQYIKVIQENGEYKITIQFYK